MLKVFQVVELEIKLVDPSKSTPDVAAIVLELVWFIALGTGLVPV